jgi:chromosome partitioning protein
VVIPLTPEDYGAQGISHALHFVGLARSANPRLRLYGYLLTMVSDRLAIHRAYRQQLEAQYGAEVFSAAVPLRAAFKEAITANLPVTTYRSNSPAALAIRLVGVELMSRMYPPAGVLTPLPEATAVPV